MKYVLPVLLLFFAHELRAQTASGALFTKLEAATTGVLFQNEIVEDGRTNMLTYEYLYNGGGVAMGDFNNDGLPDLYFTGSMAPNKLYLNKGNLVFEDITERAGVATSAGLSSGVTLVDINGDGLLDIYVCKSASASAADRRNILFVNNGNLTFTDRAREYGLADESYSTQAYFTDFDLDGDLDMYLVNHPSHMRDAKTVYLSYNDVGQLQLTDDTNRVYVSDRYYENRDGKFVDRTFQAGVDNYAYGLSAVVADFNGDHYPDIYVCNDYIKPDYLYINNKNGTFTNRFNQFFKHSSTSSMGSDYADINNDGFMDLITLDMLAEEHNRQKRLKTGSNYDHFFKNVKFGLEYQYAKNCLHLNNGNGSFSEIGYFSGVAFTDWSWSAIFQDFDLDGWKDLYVTNGYLRDVTDMDYVKYKADSVVKTIKNLKTPDQVAKLFSVIPSVKVSNYYFKNGGNLAFSNQTRESGTFMPSWSNGAAMGDLDNDGDADLVVNNFFEPAFIFRNNSVERQSGHWLKIQLRGAKGNAMGLGAIVEVKTPDGKTQTLHQMPTRGYLSQHDATLCVGLGANTSADIKVSWPGGKQQSTLGTQADRMVTLSAESVSAAQADAPVSPLFTDVTHGSGLQVRHQENDYIDFKLEPLLPRQLSQAGPAMALGDVNGDGLEDVFVGGAKGFEAAIYLQTAEGRFVPSAQPAFGSDKAYEDVQALCLDVDGDGDRDLLVGSGGNEYPGKPEMYPLRLYRNDGKGQFSRDAAAIPPGVLTSVGALAAGDVDGDGQPDVFVGGRLVPGHYGRRPKSFLLRGQNGTFSDITDRYPDLGKVGMVTGAVFTDLNKDGAPDLALVGDWMPLTLFRNGGKGLEPAPIVIDKTYGWWNTIHADDLDGDGDPDLVLGNLGLNNRYRGNEQFPVTMVVSDFDKNGSTDAVISTYQAGKSTPLVTRDNLLDQMVYLKKKFLRHSQYAEAGVADIFTPEQLAAATSFKANDMMSQVFTNEGQFNFSVSNLPKEAQLFSVKAIQSADVDGDGIRDLLLAGNEYAMEVETGRIDAGIGLWLKGKGKNRFQAIPVVQSGFFLPGDVKHLRQLTLNGTTHFLALRNQDKPVLLKQNKP